MSALNKRWPRLFTCPTDEHGLTKDDLGETVFNKYVHMSAMLAEAILAGVKQTGSSAPDVCLAKVKETFSPKEYTRAAMFMSWIHAEQTKLTRRNLQKHFASFVKLTSDMVREKKRTRGSRAPLRCPWCGGKTYAVSPVLKDAWRVRCWNPECGACGPVSDVADCAIQRWNNVGEGWLKQLAKKRRK